MNSRNIIVVFSTSLAPLHAVPRTSTSYAIPADTTDSAGRHIASAIYTNDASLGGIAGLSAVAASAETLKAGYVAQLYDITGLKLTFPGTGVAETDTIQLGAGYVLDDATLLTVPAASVAWSVLNGPLNGITPGGIAVAGIVYQDTAATVQGHYDGYTATLGLTVVNKHPDNFGSYAADSVADDWQVRYFGLDNPLAGPSLDPDGDGFDNLFEFNACLVPTDPLSFLSVTINDVPGGSHSVSFSPRFDGCTYSLLGTSDLSLWASVTGTISDAGTTRTISDPDGTGLRRFYRLEVQRR